MGADDRQPTGRPMTAGRALTVLPGQYALVRLPADGPVPGWALPKRAPFASVTRTADELSIICPEWTVPGAPDGELWRCLRIDGPFDLDEPGVLASAVAPLAAAGQSVFAVATHDTDYLLVRDAGAAARVLRAAGHRVAPASEGGAA
jgi:hypothetical protein